MARTRREHEEYLESKEPVGVVILNDLAYLLEDVSEIMLDLAKLVATRPDDMKAFMTASKQGPEAIQSLLPPKVLQFVMGAGMALAGQAMTLKAEMAPGGGSGLAGLDPDKVDPAKLKAFGQALQQQAEGLQRVIGDFEKELLAQNPPA